MQPGEPLHLRLPRKHGHGAFGKLLAGGYDNDGFEDDDRTVDEKSEVNGA